MDIIDFECSFAHAKPGETLVYHIGLLALDREDPAIDRTAACALLYSTSCGHDTGGVRGFLTQYRLSAFRYIYRITKALDGCVETAEWQVLPRASHRHATGKVVSLRPIGP